MEQGSIPVRSTMNFSNNPNNKNSLSDWNVHRFPILTKVPIKRMISMYRTPKQYLKDLVIFWLDLDMVNRKTFDNYLRKMFCQSQRYV